MANLPFPLKIAILDATLDTAEVLKAVLALKTGIQRITVFSDRGVASEAFTREGANALFIDIFSVGVREGIAFIEAIRRNHPIVPICLYSSESDLATMPGVNTYWQNRFDHYFKLVKDLPTRTLSTSVDAVLASLSYELQANVARDKLSDLKIKLIDQRGSHAESQVKLGAEVKFGPSAQEIEETVATALTALEARQQQQALMVVPGIEAAQMKQFIVNTLNETRQSLQLNRRVNIGVLFFGAFLVLISLILKFAIEIDIQETIVFGGLGMAGIVASLITNPLKSISASAGSLVQIQAAYFQFILQLKMLSQESSAVTLVERSKMLADVTERTIKILK